MTTGGFGPKGANVQAFSNGHNVTTSSRRTFFKSSQVEESSIGSC
jgi:hypothetical protein